MHSTVTLRCVKEKHAAAPGLVPAGRAYMFLRSSCSDAYGIRRAITRIKGTPNRHMAAILAGINRELKRLKADPDLAVLSAGITDADADRVKKLQGMWFLAYPIREVRRGSTANFAGKESPVIALAEEWGRKGANYVIRTLLPGGSNYETAELLLGISSDPSFRAEVFGSTRHPVHDVYFRGDDGSYVSISHFKAAAQEALA